MKNLTNIKIKQFIQNNRLQQYGYFIFFWGLQSLVLPTVGLAQTAAGTKIIDSRQSNGAVSASAGQHTCLQWATSTNAYWTQTAGSAAEVECSEITPILKVSHSPYRSRVGKIDFLTGITFYTYFDNTYYAFSLEFHCQRRPLGDSQAISQLHQCKKNPSEICVSPEYLQYINSVSQTKYNELNASACSQLLGGSSNYGGSSFFGNSRENGGAEFR